MARPAKVGLDYFELDCHMSEKVRLIQAEFGLKGFAVVVKLFQKIYGEFGYYCEWNNDSSLLFASENGASSRDEKNLINEIVQACIRRNIFSKKLYKESGILTSESIQENYLNAVSRREKVFLNKEYLLVSVGKNNQNVVLNEVNVDKNEVNVGRNTQSREEEIKEENIIKPLCKTEVLTLFESLWKLYPIKKGKGQISFTAKQRLFKLGYDEMVRAINRYKDDLACDSDWRKPQNGSTFFNSGYIDYLDQNYTPPLRNKTNKGKNQFQNFPQRAISPDYSAELEKRLLNGKTN